jgi:hypothetical protein
MTPSARIRVGFPTHKITDLRNKSQEDWDLEEGITVVRTIFPNVSFAISAKHGGMMSQLFPGPTPDKSRTIQNHIYPQAPTTSEERALMDASVSLFVNAVQNEDNWVCDRIQRGLLSGGNKNFVFGKNELGLHRLHDWIDYYVNARAERPSDTIGEGRANGPESNRPAMTESRQMAMKAI